MSVTIILPDNKRLTVKATVNSLLSEILEKVCTNKGLDSNSYTFFRNNRAVDLGLTLRLANIPLNAELYLVCDPNRNTNQKVTISVQYGDRDRKIAEFESTSSLWFVIESLFGECCPELCDENMVFSINHMNRKFEGKDVLQQTTLKIIGICSGRVALRMNSRPKDQESVQKFVENIKFKKPEKKENQKSNEKPIKTKVEPIDLQEPSCSNQKPITKNEPEQEIPDKQNQEPAESVSVITKFVNENSIFKQLKKNKDSSNYSNVNKKPLICVNPSKQIDSSVVKPSKSDSLGENQDHATQESISSEEILCEKDVKFLGGVHEEILYSLNDCPNFVEQDLPPDFFDVTAGDLKRLLNELRRQQFGKTQANLETQKLREEREKMQQEKFQLTILRIVFPYDQRVLQAIFKPTDTIELVHQIISKYTKHNDFHLFTAPPKMVLNNPTNNLYQLQLIPSGLIYCSSNKNQESLIKEEYEAQISTQISAKNFAINRIKSIYNKLDTNC